MEFHLGLNRYHSINNNLMNRYRLQAQLRNVGIAYALFICLGAHYAYVNKWGMQILFWLTFGGFGIWWLIDLFRIPGMIYDFNDPIYDDLDWLDEQEREWQEGREEFLELKRLNIQRKQEIFQHRYR